MNKKCFIISITLFMLIYFAGICPAEKSAKIYFSGDGVELTQDDLNVENSFLSSNFRAPVKEKLKVLLTNRLFSMDARKNWDDPLFKKKIQIMTEKFISILYKKKILESIKIPDTVLKSYYTANQDQFKTSAELKLKMIMTDHKFICDKIFQDIKNGVRTFADAAEKESLDENSRKKKGDLGWIAERRMPKEFLMNLKDFKIGQTGKPFQYGKSWFILKLVDKKPSKIKSFNQVKKFIKNKLIQKEQIKKIYSEFNRLKKEYNVKEVSTD